MHATMGETKECPSPFCTNVFEYPDGPEQCPECQFPVLEWLATQREAGEGDASSGEPAE